jgi:DNA-binding SARP family transcriptional activator
MASQNLTSVTVKRFRELTAGKKVVLLYPWTTYRTVFLARLLEVMPSGLIYYRLQGEAPDLVAFVTALVGELADVLEGFGEKLKAALDSGSPTQMGQALVADLQALQDDRPLVLYLDEFDRLVAEVAVSEWVEAVVAALPVGMQLAINSRQLDRDPWSGMVARGEACVFGTAYRKDDGMFTLDDKARPQLEVYGLGRGHVLVNGQEIVHWDGALPRNLFFYLVDHPLITRDEIFATFWPELDVKAATNVFHVTKRKIGELISARVADGGSYPLTQFSQGFYRLNEAIAQHYDVNDFLEAVDEAMGATSEAQEQTLLTRAIALYQGPFLETVTMPWANQRRDQVRREYTQALISLARWHQRQGDLPEALGFYLRAVKEAPEREDVHREVMQIYLAQGRDTDAQRQYLALDRILDELYGIRPSNETRELYETLQSKL